MGIPTINNIRAIRLVRNKAVATVYAYVHGLPMPPTYLVAHPRLLKQIPPEDYPIVVKPSNGSSGRGIYRVSSPADLDALVIAEEKASFFLAQRYAENAGFDIKVYITGREVYAAIAKKSPLHGDVAENFIPLTSQLRKLALDIGKIFGLDIYGIDVVETPQGLAVLDINELITKIPFGLHPLFGDSVGHIQFDPVTHRIFAVTLPLNDQNLKLPATPPSFLAVIDPMTLQVVSHIRLPDACLGPHGLAIDVQQREAFVACVNLYVYARGAIGPLAGIALKCRITVGAR